MNDKLKSNQKNKAIVLLSGGLDSTTVLYYAISKGFDPHVLIFSYNQKHVKEIDFAKKIANKVSCSYQVIPINLPWQGSSLLDDRSVPQSQTLSEGIPSTYVPGRNIIFLSFAASYAEVINADTIFIGANAIDYSGYPDCRPDFINAFQTVLEKGLKVGQEGRAIKLSAPLLDKTKKEIIQLGLDLGVPYDFTWSCYVGGDRPCGKCDSCKLREKGFQSLNVKDPAL